MRRPAIPPKLTDVLALADGSRLAAVLLASMHGAERTYLPWDDLRRREPPAGLSREEYWIAVRLARRMQARNLPLVSPGGAPFSFVPTDALTEACHQIDFQAGGRVATDERILNPATRDQYVFDSLVEEAIASSQIEGAVTTRRVAKEMIRTGRAPRTNDERMIVNNFRAMEHVRQMCTEALTVERVLELHRIVTEGTLDDPEAEGRLRQQDDIVVTDQESGEDVHTPPPAAELAHRLDAMCAFANGETPSYYVHPLVRAMVLHFWLAYDHPFEDGNGRTARVLFYWSVLREGYWLFQFLPISRVIQTSKRAYYRAFLLTETDEGDVTYFLLYHLDAVRKAQRLLDEYLKARQKEIRRVESVVRASAVHNHRQQALIAHALRHSDAEYTFESHSRSHGVTYQTARTDLLDLEEQGVLGRRKRGRAFVFRPVPDLENVLSTL